MQTALRTGTKAAWIGLCVFASTAVGTAAGSAEGGWVAAGSSRARLNWCPPADRATAGKASQAFLELSLDPGWKTYWRMPGDAGVAPSFDWAEAINIGTATVEYPAPHRMADQGGEAVGYKTAVVFPITLQARDTTAASTVVVTFSYGICKNICVPAELKLTGDCHGPSPAHQAALDAVPRSGRKVRPGDPKLVAVTGSVMSVPPRLMVDVDFGKDADSTDLFIEAPEGLFVPLPAPARPDGNGRVRYVVDLAKTIDAKDLLGKQLRLTMVGSKGAAEALWVAK